MRSTRTGHRWAGVMVAAILMMLAAIVAPAQSYTVLYTFSGGTDGGEPLASLNADAAGNLYGTTFIGGAYNSGVVFKLDPAGNETVLHAFTGGADGYLPSAGLSRDAAGNLYGTTDNGGNVGGSCAPIGCGVVFKLDPAGNETVLHSFGGADGTLPAGTLVRDSTGNLYGTSDLGGVGGGSCFAGGCGLIFKLDSVGNETVLHSFVGTDGANPIGGLIRDAAGNLYGTTYGGGTHNAGTVFKLDSLGNETVLRSFSGPDGKQPTAGLVRDGAGNLYGTTSFGGESRGDGVVFELRPNRSEQVLHAFTGESDGLSPAAGLVRDATGNLYGTTATGGLYGWGVVFKLSPSGTETVLYNFAGQADGAFPQAGLLPLNGYLYGTTQYTGAGFSGYGVVFRLKP